MMKEKENGMQQQGNSRNSPNDSGGYSRNLWSPVVKSGGAQPYALFFFLLLLLIAAFVSTRLLLGPSVLFQRGPVEKELVTDEITRNEPKPPEYTLDCDALNRTGTCPRNTYRWTISPDRRSPSTCPDYFRWIHEDLRPWARTGITRDAVERAQETANFHLAIIDGRVYVKKLRDGFQTRDVFTLWGFLQMVRRYLGNIPDLELMFDCVDWPVVKAVDYGGENASSPPPLFRYCKNDETLDIVFPDWSFWGWAEVNIKPWGTSLKALNEGNQRTGWIERQPYAYWKGNPTVAETRQDLMKCNVSEGREWNARLYTQDWLKESKEGYKQSDLASQCVHRYKIYIEGSAWSVSEKYILSCDSVTLLVKPHYYDFFTRGLVPLRHYWPVKEDDKCRSIKFAVDWGNNNKEKAQNIGKTASKFVQEELNMDYVYDYMFHLLNEYSKLLRFKPQIPQDADELCSETMVCPRDGNEKKFMMESLVKSPSETGPCRMPTPYDPATLNSVLRRRETSVNKVEKWEKEYWNRQGQ